MPSGDARALKGQALSFDYDPERHAFVFWNANDPGALTILPTATLTAQRIAMPITPPVDQTDHGVWGRFRRYAPHQYCLMAGMSYPLVLFTLS